MNRPIVFFSHILSGVVSTWDFRQVPWSIGIIVDGFEEERKKNPALDLFKYLVVYFYRKLELPEELAGPRGVKSSPPKTGRWKMEVK